MNEFDRPANIDICVISYNIFTNKGQDSGQYQSIIVFGIMAM